MELGLKLGGTATPRAHMQPIPGSARRPHSARQSRNPITGKEVDHINPQAGNSYNATASQSRPSIVPALNLNYLHQNEEPTGAINVSLRDYNVETPRTASTVSWGTGHSALVNKKENQLKGPAVQISNMPEHPVDAERRPSSARVMTKEPSAWDKVPVPEDLPAPSARYQQMYKQYTEEMKNALRTHSNTSKVSEEKIQCAAQTMKQKGQIQVNHPPSDEDIEKEDQEDVGEDVVDERWKKQRYTSNQLHKKLDAEGLLEQNKKLKLIETVMIDQLSRAVISDPEQEQRNTGYGGDATRRAARGTYRYLHDSKVSTRGTATENLLSRRLRFGARIRTRNGRDAVRELTGFFFQVDRSLTVYEFKQFGKSAKAIPFIQRGIFHHPAGPKSGLPFSLSDIYTGADLLILTKGQPTLSIELMKYKYLPLRVIDVDENEKAELRSEEEEKLTSRPDEPSQVALENQRFLLDVQESAQAQIRKRAIRTITGLGHHYRQLDKDGTGQLLQHDLERGLLKFHIDLPPQVLEQVFDIVDPEGERRLDYSIFMRTVLGEMNEFRKALVRKAFSKLDTRKQGCIDLSNIKKFFNANCLYKSGSDADSTKSALQSFLDTVRSSSQQEEVSFIEFEEYYEGLSLGLDDDQDFANILRNTWNI